MLHASAMGTWGPGPFYNDAAAAFLDALRASPTRLIAKTLREIACIRGRKYIDVDDGAQDWTLPRVPCVRLQRHLLRRLLSDEERTQ